MLFQHIWWILSGCRERGNVTSCPLFSLSVCLTFSLSSVINAEGGKRSFFHFFFFCSVSRRLIDFAHCQACLLTFGTSILAPASASTLQLYKAGLSPVGENTTVEVNGSLSHCVPYFPGCTGSSEGCEWCHNCCSCFTPEPIRLLAWLTMQWVFSLI